MSPTDPRAAAARGGASPSAPLSDGVRSHHVTGHSSERTLLSAAGDGLNADWEQERPSEGGPCERGVLGDAKKTYRDSESGTGPPSLEWFF